MELDNIYKIGIAGAGKYYLENFNIIIQTTIADNPAPEAIASQIAGADQQGGMGRVLDAVQAYLAWLEEQEKEKMQGDSYWYWPDGLMSIVSKSIETQVAQIVLKDPQG